MPATQPKSPSALSPANPWTRLFLPACLFVYLALAIAYSFVFPLSQAPDETGHFQYVLFLAEHVRLPDFYQDSQAGYESYQAPLYYTVCAAVCKPWASAPTGRDQAGDPSAGPPAEPRPSLPEESVGESSAADSLVARETHQAALDALRWAATLPPHARQAWHAARLVSVLFGALGLVLCYLTLGAIFPRRPQLAALVAAGIAAHPMYVHITSSVGNDAATVAIVAASLLLTLLLLRDGPDARRVALLGLLLGLGMLTKDSALICVPVALLALAWAVGKRREPQLSPSALVRFGRWLAALRWRELLVYAGLMLGVALAVGGWWYVRNAALYGKPLHYPVNVEKQMLWHFYFVYPELLWPTLRAAVRMTFRNFWATFGWTNVAVWPPAYNVLLVLSLVPVLGWVGLVADSVRDRLDWSVFQHRAFWVLVIALGLTMMGVVRYVLFIHLGGGSQGRYYFPVLASLGLLAALGLDRLLPDAARKAAPVVVGGLMLLFNLWCLFGHIIPHYRALSP